jgi:predicted O-methyltransferase YrrM
MIQLLRFFRNVASPSRDRRLSSLEQFANTIIPDYRLTWAQLDWWDDQSFNQYLDRFAQRRRFNTHRKWMLWQLLRLIEKVPGDTAECGVFEGASSWLMCAATRGQGRMHHMFDSFEGLSAPSAEDKSYWQPGALAAGEDLVRRNLAPFEGSFDTHKGWIPDRFSDVEGRRFAFVHIDVDLFEPTRDSIEFFYPRLEPGGIILCDDYAFSSCPGATAAIDRYLADKPEKMIGLDAGGGFFIKGVETSPQRDPRGIP